MKGLCDKCVYINSDTMCRYMGKFPYTYSISFGSVTKCDAYKLQVKFIVSKKDLYEYLLGNN